MKNIITFGWFMLAGLMLAGCASDRGSEGDLRPMLSGSINYRARIALPSSAVMTVRLLDITQKESPAISLAYPFGGISPNRNYVIDARIEVDGRLRFYTMKQHVVTPQNATDQHELWLQLSGG